VKVVLPKMFLDSASCFIHILKYLPRVPGLNPPSAARSTLAWNEIRVLASIQRSAARSYKVRRITRTMSAVAFTYVNVRCLMRAGLVLLLGQSKATFGRNISLVSTQKDREPTLDPPNTLTEDEGN
jgi:hypothetical protein